MMQRQGLHRQELLSSAAARLAAKSLNELHCLPGRRCRRSPHHQLHFYQVVLKQRQDVLETAQQQRTRRPLRPPALPFSPIKGDNKH